MIRNSKDIVKVSLAYVSHELSLKPLPSMIYSNLLRLSLDLQRVPSSKERDLRRRIKE